MKKLLNCTEIDKEMERLKRFGILLLALLILFIFLLLYNISLNNKIKFETDRAKKAISEASALRHSWEMLYRAYTGADPNFGKDGADAGVPDGIPPEDGEPVPSDGRCTPYDTHTCCEHPNGQWYEQQCCRVKHEWVYCPDS